MHKLYLPHILRDESAFREDIQYIFVDVQILLNTEMFQPLESCVDELNMSSPTNIPLEE